MTPIDWAVWLVFGTLDLLLLLQLENTRSFTRPRPNRRNSLPSLSVFVGVRDDARSIHARVRSLARQEYPGRIETIVLHEGASGPTGRISPFSELDP